MALPKKCTFVYVFKANNFVSCYFYRYSLLWCDYSNLLKMWQVNIKLCRGDPCTPSVKLGYFWHEVLWSRLYEGGRLRVRDITLTNHWNLCVKYFTSISSSIKVSWIDFILFQMKAIYALVKLNMMQTYYWFRELCPLPQVYLLNTKWKG